MKVSGLSFNKVFRAEPAPEQCGHPMWVNCSQITILVAPCAGDRSTADRAITTAATNGKKVNVPTNVVFFFIIVSWGNSC